MTKPKLMEHQIAGIEFLREYQRAALFDEPGLGKSIQALKAAVEPILVVAPAMVIDGGVWDDEIEKWAPGLDVTQRSYHSIIQKDGRKHTGDLLPELRREWGTVIADEAHYLKGRKTFWTQAFKKLRSERMILLTGTPLPNWAHEAFVLLQLLYPDEAKPGGRLGSYWCWVEEWFEIGEQYGKGGVVVSDHVVGDFRKDREWEDFISENWQDRMLLRLRKDCLDLPPLTEQMIRVDMVPAQKKAYRELKKDFVTWLDSGEEVAVWSQAGQLVKLAKCATGLESLADSGTGSGKLDALQTLLTDRDLPSLVVAHFRSSVAACAVRARAAGKSVAIVDGGTSKPQRTAHVRAFQAGKVDVLCATIDTISEGLTLNAADQVIKVERSWRPSRNEQVLRRIHRIGQDKPVTAIDLVTRGSVDERVLKVLAGKQDQQMKALGREQLRDLV
jgi:SWI/SNF-related matrix-associated actin-dependent regulator 1 of chromatin subfamily A